MPFLEQPRRSSAPPAEPSGRLIPGCGDLLRLSRRHWPPVWLACQLLSFVAGGHWGSSHPQCADLLPATGVANVVRVTTMLPLFLGASGGCGATVVWLAVAVGNGLAGAAESAQRQQRPRAAAPAPWAPAVLLRATGDAVVRITGWPRRTSGDRWSAPARLLAWAPRAESAGGVEPGLGDGIMLVGKSQPPAPAAVIAGPLTVTVPPMAAVPGSFDYRRFLTGRGLRWQGRLATQRSVAAGDRLSACGRDILSPVRTAIVDRLATLMPAREAQLAGAVLLGVRSSDSRAISAPFSTLGLAHLFAVSGLHVGILLGIILLPGRLGGWSPRAMVGPLWLLIPLFLLLTGMPASVARAGGMGLLAAQARPWGRKGDALRLLGLLYWAGTVLDPRQNLDAGLQLSYLAAGGILLVNRATDGLRFGRRRWLRPVLGGLAVSFAAQWFTLPVVAQNFGQISRLSLVANLVSVPLFGVAMWAVVLALVASVAWLPLGQMVGALAWIVLRGLNGGVAWISAHTGGLAWGLAVPDAPRVLSWLALSLVLVLGLRLRVRQPRRWPCDLVAWGVLPLLLLRIFGPGASAGSGARSVVVWQFDVGQGDCALVVFPDRWTAMIDTGGRFGYTTSAADGPLSRNILTFLRRQGIDRIDAVLLTHGHLDHTGGALALDEAVTVGTWWVSGRAAEILADRVDSTQIARPTAGTVLHRWSDWCLRVHYPLPGQTAAASENNRSLVTALSCGDRTEMVWSGDLELAGEARLLAAGPALAATRVWKAGHHGSDTSGSAAWLARTRPELVLISCGLDNRHGHPSHGPYVVPDGAGRDTIPLLRTDLAGSIRLTWRTDKLLHWRTRTAEGEVAPAP